MNTTTSPPPKPNGIAHDPAWLHSELTRRIDKSKDPALEEKLLGHLHAKTGYKSLGAFHLAGTKKQKVEVYSDLLRAMITKNFSGLLGQPQEPEPMVDADIQIEEVVDGAPNRIHSPKDEERSVALSTLLELLATPGVVAQVKVWVTLVKMPQEPPDPMSMAAINDNEAYLQGASPIPKSEIPPHPKP